MISPDIQAIVDVMAKKYELDPKLVTAVIMKETSGKIGVNRYEPTWKYPVDVIGWARRLTKAGYTTTSLTERVNQYTSWGLMQVMGSVARELGHATPIPLLVIPEIGIEYGCRKLSQLFDRYKTVEKVLDAYNSGNPFDQIGKDYVSGVLKFMT